jgi:RND superfamily putative drug exporter
MAGSTAHWDPARPRTGRVSGVYASWVVRARWAVIGGWLFLAAASLVAPATGGGLASGVEGFVSSGDPAVQTEIRTVERFGFPLYSRTLWVQRAPEGMDPLIQAEAVARAAAITQGSYPEAGPIVGAIPVPNAFGFFPGARERGTSVLTLLFIPPTVSFTNQYAAARQLAASQLDSGDAFVGVTGSVPARVEQGRLVGRWLPWVELATITAVVLIVAVNFRSLVAPLPLLITLGIAVLVMSSLTAVVGRVLGVPVPGELEPLMVALLIGVVTDYVIFYLSAFRRHLVHSPDRREASRRSTGEFTTIIVVAGVTVAAGTAALLAARSQLFRTFGPGMALAVAVGLTVSVTLVPALMAVLGRGLFWPFAPTEPRPARHESGGREPAGDNRRAEDLAEIPGPAPARLFRRVFRGPVIEVMTRPRVAAAILLTCLAGLLLAALPVRHLTLGAGFVSSLPADTEVRRAAVAAEAGFAEGIMSPTTLLLEAPGITSHRTQLHRLGDLIADEPGVAGVLGPGNQPVPTELGIVLARNGGAARFLIVLDSSPLDARAIDSFGRLQQRLPDLLAAADLSGVRMGLAGDTAIAHTVVDGTVADLGRIALVGLLVNLVLLVVFLRALIAPLYLLACSILAALAALGVTTLVFQGFLGHDGLTFYVPFAAAILLLALGSDYNIFGVGHIWGEARHRPLRQAIAVAVPQSTRAITAAGITLATSFGMLSLVPLRPFRELALAMFVGILLDAMVVRSLLVPSLLTLVGRFSAWPGSLVRTAGADSSQVTSGQSQAVGEDPPCDRSGAGDRPGGPHT